MAHMGITNRSWDTAVVATPSDTVNEPTGPFQAFVIWTGSGTPAVATVSFVDQAGNASGTSGSIAVGTTVFCKGVRINATGTTGTILLLKAPA